MVHVIGDRVIAETESVRPHKSLFALRVAGLHAICHNQLHKYPETLPASMTDFSKYSDRVSGWQDYSRIELNHLGVECVEQNTWRGAQLVLRDRRNDIDFEESASNVEYFAEIEDGTYSLYVSEPGTRDIVLEIPSLVWEEDSSLLHETYKVQVKANSDVKEFFSQLTEAVKFSQGTASSTKGSKLVATKTAINS